MSNAIRNLLCFFLCFSFVFVFSSCKTDENNGENIPAEPESFNEILFMAEEQGIGVLSACRISDDTESVSLEHSEDIAGIVVYNDSEKTLQYAVITATFSDNTVYTYKISTLPPGEACMVAEESSAPYRELSTGFFGFEIFNVAFFAEEPSVYSDKLQFSGADGILNVKNISGTDITDNIVVYYKDYIDTQFTSGVTYRVTVTGGLKAGEIKQISANNYKQDESMIMFAQFVSAEVE